MLLMFSRGFKDSITKIAKFKEFPGLENKFQNSRGFKEIKDTWEPCCDDDQSMRWIFLRPTTLLGCLFCNDNPSSGHYQRIVNE